MEIDRKRVEAFFAEYTAAYDASDEKIKLKIDHTYRVAALCEEIAASLHLSREDVDLAWLCGMLHDVGRFEQLRRYGTFVDAQSIDHAAFGASLLFPQGQDELIRSFVSDNTEDELIQIAVLTHSAYRLPQNLDERTEMYCDILRDADKIDILRVNVDVPLEAIYNCTTQELLQGEISPEVMEAYHQEHAVLRALKKTPVDNIAGHIALVFELVFPISAAIVMQQGYLDKLLHFHSENEVTQRQFAVLREHMEVYLQHMINSQL